jgi:serine/threonine protein kinase
VAGDPGIASMFIEEAKVALALSHANVVQAFEVGISEDRYFLAMEHVDGIDLGALIRVCRDRLCQPLPHRHALYVAIEALKGLDYAHRCRDAGGRPLRLVHRDISPGNILLSREGEVKLADFGIAKSSLRASGSMAGSFKGKLLYMSPEQLLGEPIDARADVYAMGCVLYEMFTGRRMFRGDGASVIPDVMTGMYPRPREVDPAIPEGLEAICLRALELEPNRRWPTAAAMGAALEDLAWSLTYRLSSKDFALFLERALEWAAQAKRWDTATAEEPTRDAPDNPPTMPEHPRALRASGPRPVAGQVPPRSDQIAL